MEPIQLRFLFANKEGVKIIVSTTRDKYVSDVKRQLLEFWPADVPKPDSLLSIRLICMGLGMLQDTKTLAESKVPVLPVHPTPINVSLLPPKSESQALLVDQKAAAGGASAAHASCWCTIS
ncbi:hypothetical protein AC1031_001686 [Aphanomyces cochlioides]|nr:hypothetical protein AC1031_001686 [Aphanomyces cochlioides]